MHCQILFFMFYFIIYYYDFVKSNALVGRNVRTVAHDKYTYVVCIIRVNPNVPLQKTIICTATIISKNHVVLTEHCINSDDDRPLAILAGSSNINSATRYYPAWIKTYDQWARTQNLEIVSENDIAVIKTTTELPVELGKAIIEDYEFYRYLVGYTVTMVGWGESNAGELSENLQAVNTTIVSIPECLAVTSRLRARNPSISHDVFVCSKATPYALLRNGDSGGPLLFGNILVGINKATCPIAGGSGNQSKLNVHLRLEVYLSYINAMLAQ